MHIMSTRTRLASIDTLFILYAYIYIMHTSPIQITTMRRRINPLEYYYSSNSIPTMQTTGGSMNTIHTLSMHTIPSLEQIVLIVVVIQLSISSTHSMHST